MFFDSKKLQYTIINIFEICCLLIVKTLYIFDFALFSFFPDVNKINKKIRKSDDLLPVDSFQRNSTAEEKVVDTCFLCAPEEKAVKIHTTSIIV